MNEIYTWRTSKVSNGYSFSVYKMTPRKTPNKMGQYADDKLMKYGILPSRARAKTMAIKWIKYYKSKR